MDTIITQPSATPVIQSLRNIGYKAQTAIADIVDNGIDAAATDIHITFEYNNGNSYIAIQDNGIGMSDEELQTAMTIGSKDPRVERKQHELGRFGMGLKTASFSLGQRLSVLTKKDGTISERCWDLDYVSEQNEWYLFKKIPNEVKEMIGTIESDNGTIIFIDKLDRFCGYGIGKIIKPSSYYAKVGRIRKYLEMVYHFKLDGGLNIYINNNILVPWDPFLCEQAKTIEGETQVIKVNGKKMKITPYVLPHPSVFNEMEYKLAGGSKGWRDQQGFYIYREGRLVNFGDWFGLFPKDSFSELVRIKIDFTNAADDDWKIDVKKTSISVPDDAIGDLKAIGKYYRQVSKEIMLFRVRSSRKQVKMKGSLHTWELANDEANSPFVLNHNHSILMDILRNIDEDTRRKLNNYLKLVELGSPNNLLHSSNLVKREEQVQEVDMRIKGCIIELAKILIGSNEIVIIEEIVDAISLFPGFETLERNTIKSIVEKDVLVYEK